MVAVLDENKRPLMPCTEKRARKLLEKGQAKPYWYKGVFSIILQRPPKTHYKQSVCVGVDPGSKWEGISLKTESKTLLNIQTDAKTDVKNKVEVRRSLRQARRQRKTRYRKCRFNRKRRLDFLSPSTKSRWDWKITIINTLRKLYPIDIVGIEDIKAETIKGARQWNVNFSPIEVGKNYFRKWVSSQNLRLFEFEGFDTYTLRLNYNLPKNSLKSKKDFFTHCVDSWVIANEVIGGHIEPDNTRVVYVKPLCRYRRQLHVQNPVKNGFRKNYGSTRSIGIERGTLVKHPKYGICLVGGTSKGRISLHDLVNNKRLCQNAKVEDLRILTNCKWNIQK